IEGLAAKFVYSYYANEQFLKRWRKKFEMHDYNSNTDEYFVVNTFNSPSSLYGYYQPAKRTSLTGQLSYSKLFADAHSLNVLMAFEERYEKNDNIWAQKQFVIDIDQFFAGQS